MDITDTLAPKSDQLDAVDLLGGPMTFTIERVTKGSSEEQPVQVHLAEFPRVWRPGKSMRRVLAAAWTPHASEWTGRRVTLYCDTTVKFGGIEVGGIRISHLSDIDGPKKVPLLITKGKSAMFMVQPLKDAAPSDPDVATAAQLRTLNGLLRDNGITQKDLALALYADVTGREVEASKVLTTAEADAVIVRLMQMRAAPVAAEPVEDADEPVNEHWAPQDDEPAP